MCVCVFLAGEADGNRAGGTQREHRVSPFVDDEAWRLRDEDSGLLAVGLGMRAILF